MLPSKSSFMDHFRWLRWAAKAHGVEVLLELDSMKAFLRKDGRHWVLHPRFIAEIDGVPNYFSQFTDECSHLAGWTAAQLPGWPAAKDKLTFKRAAMQLGLPVPAFSAEPNAVMEQVVVKRASGSFGQHVHGPFRSTAERPLRLAEGEYYERFIEGQDLKIWYWGDAPVAMERDTMPTMVGDGVSSFRQLVHARVRPKLRITPERLERIFARCAAMLQYDGLSLEDVPAKGTRHRVEFRYGTEVMQLTDRQVLDLRDKSDPQWQLLHEAGPKLAQLVPAGVRNIAMFTVDAVQDAQGRIWLLEMNSHPTVHPLIYDPMVRSLLAMDFPVAEQTAPVASA